MPSEPGVLVIGGDATLVGEVRNCSRMEIHGEVQGAVIVERLVIAESGRLIGTIRAGTAEVNGTFEGRANVRDVVRIGASGSITGDVQYGKLAVVAGGLLSASVRNVPPTIFGDLEISVPRGGSVRISTADLTAFDPDDDARSLQFTVSTVRHGRVALDPSLDAPIAAFAQSDLEAGHVTFVHDGSAGTSAGFDVIVKDGSGASSGAPRTVRARVVPPA